MSTPLKALISRLTPTARRAVEEAASRALSRTHFEIEIEHVLLAILAQFRTGNTRNPVLSSWLPSWIGGESGH